MKVRITAYLDPFGYCDEWELDLDIIPRIGDLIVLGKDGLYYNESGTHHYSEMVVRVVQWDFGLENPADLDENDKEDSEDFVWIFGDVVWEYAKRKTDNGYPIRPD